MEPTIESNIDDSLETMVEESFEAIQEESLESDTESKTSSTRRIKIKVNETDYADIEEEIYDYMDEYMETEILQMSKPSFNDIFIQSITEIIYEYWLHCGLCTEDDIEDIEELIETIAENYFMINDIPSRSISYETILDQNQQNLETRNQQILQQIQTLIDVPQVKQKTPAWYEQRSKLITASNIWKCLSSQSNQNSIIYEKCKPHEGFSMDYVNTNSPMHWGVKYEPLTIMVYEHMYQTEIQEFGCIPHPTYSFIGASPDGINVDPNSPRYGSMLEIKNIYNRDITQTPKEEYWIQCQVQMETCNLDDCDFVETRFNEYPNEDNFYEDTSHEYKGVILYFIKRVNNERDLANFQENGNGNRIATTSLQNANNPHYVYMPLDMSSMENPKESIETWIREKKEELATDYVLFSTLYWYLDEFSCMLIKRNRKWFQAALPKFAETWDTIIKERVDGFSHRMPNKRVKHTSNTILHSNDKIVVEKTVGEHSQQIKNMPQTNRICLVKLPIGE
jgi:putative phage-type endonuclease